MTIEIKITPAMKKQFVSEAAAHLDRFEKMLLVFEKEPRNEEAIHSAFRAIHSIKGNSDYIGLKDINTLSHSLEDLMDDVRGGRLRMDKAMLGVLFECLDLLRDMNRQVTRKDYRERDVSAIVARIAHFKQDTAPDAALTPKRREALDIEAVFYRSSSQQWQYIKGLAEQITAGEQVPQAKKNVLRTLKTLYISANYAGFSELAAVVRDMQDRIEKIRSMRPQGARYILDKAEIVQTLLNAIGKPESRQKGPAATPEALFVDALGRELRVDPEKVDGLMNRVSELLIAKNSLNHTLGEPIRDPETGDRDHQLRQIATRISKITDDLQSETMKLRLVRINSLFERLPRLVRELSLQSRKKIELTLLGEETEIDRKVVEHLVDPLIHLIRNSVDHGIEPRAARLKNGKPAQGTLTVKANQEGNYVIIEVIDDGRGIHTAEIRQTALKRKIVTPQALEGMTPEEILNLIFRPGYSTAREKTRVSGRGVGLDIVKNNLKNMGGNVTLLSEPGSGTRIRLQVPLSMAVMDVLLVEVAGEQYAIPFSAILENIKVKRGEIQVLNRKEVVTYNDTVIGIRHLGRILGLSPDTKLRVKGSQEELTVIVAAFGGQIAGVVVDRIIRRDAILDKPLESHLAQIKEFSGAALMGDGSIVLVLDPMGMF